MFTMYIKLIDIELHNIMQLTFLDIISSPFEAPAVAKKIISITKHYLLNFSKNFMIKIYKLTANIN